ncbi:MAG: hypothetical protein ACI8RZ_001359 [Myxococcota bacterium]|jgi:hypothetical protein
MGKDFETLLSTTHAEAGRNLKKVVASKGKLQGNLYFAGDGKKTAGVVITLTARDPKGMKALTGGKGLRKGIKGAKFARGTVIMDGGKLVVELSTGSATAALLKKAFKDDAFKKDSALKLLSRATIRKQGAPGEEAEVEEGTGLSQEDLNIASDAFESRGFWRKSELKELMKAQGSLSAANAELQASFLSVSSIQEEEGARVTELEGLIEDLNEKLNQAVEDGDRDAAMGYELLITSEERKLTEAQSVGSDPFSGGLIDPAIAALMGRVQSVPLERRALEEAHEETKGKRRSKFMKSVFASVFESHSSGVSSMKGFRLKADDAVFQAEQRERFEQVRLELDGALSPLLAEHGQFDRLIQNKKTAEAKKAGAGLLERIQGLINRARKELEVVRVDLQH